MLISHNQHDPEVFDVYRVNVHTGAAILVAQNPGNIVGWQTDHAGKVRAAITSDDLDTTLLYRDTETDAFRPLIITDYRNSVNPIFFTFDNQKFYALSNRGRDKEALVIIDPAHHDSETLVYASDLVDLDGAGYSRKRKVLTMAEYEIDTPHYHFFDTQTEALHSAISDLLSGYEIAIQGMNRDENTFIIATYNDRTLGSRYLYDATAPSLTKLADINPAIPEADMAPMQSIQYQSRDGLTLHGYLTVPVGRDPKNLSCIINPHGDPWARDSWGYNPEIQFLANRGFCVLQINFRSSTGYRRACLLGGGVWPLGPGHARRYYRWRALPSRPNLYAAAVDYVGVSNLFTFMNTIPPYWKPLLAKMYDMVAHPEKDKERLAATSPALHADKITTPLLIAQDAKDPRVNKNESDQVVKALKARGVEVEYMVKDNEGHGFHNDENKFEFYEAMERFFAQHLKP